ncbi:MAG: hypothetical protein IPJ75_16280 [Ignavibacteriales bacterium]|nr:hypothetical protein [Ignavibacteriales bacterium]
MLYAGTHEINFALDVSILTGIKDNETTRLDFQLNGNYLIHLIRQQR